MRFDILQACFSNEVTDVIPFESYDRRFGYYPKVVLADQLYGSRENRKYLNEKGIRFGGKALGLPPKLSPEIARQMREQRIQDSRERIPIEGRFGQGKNGYRLNYIRAKLQKTSEAWINCIFLVMNLMVLLKKWLKKRLHPSFPQIFAICIRLLALIVEKCTRQIVAGPKIAWCSY